MPNSASIACGVFGIAIDDGGVFAAGDVVPLGLEEILGQQQLHASLGGVVLLHVFAVLHQPAAEDFFDVFVICVAAGRHQAFADEHEQVERQLLRLLVEQFLVGEIGIECQPLVAQPQVHGRLQERGERAGFVDRQADAAHPR